MGLFTGGQQRTGVFVGGEQVNGVWRNGINRLTGTLAIVFSNVSVTRTTPIGDRYRAVYDYAIEGIADDQVGLNQNLYVVTSYYHPGTDVSAATMMEDFQEFPRDGNFSIADTPTGSIVGSGDQTSPVLAPGDYTVRLLLIQNRTPLVGIGYSNAFNLTLVAEIPMLTLSFGSITQTGVSVGFTNSGGIPQTQTFEYGTSTAYGTTVLVTATQTQVVLDDLDPDEEYFFRIIATNTGGIDTETDSFTTDSADAAPGVTTLAATSQLATSIRFNGRVDNEGSSTVDTRGFYWLAGTQTTANTIQNGARLAATAGDNSGFSAVRSSLSPSSTYSFVAYANNGEGEEGRGLRLLGSTTAQLQTADWRISSSGNPSGGTGGAITTGTYGAWGGGTNIQFGTDSRPNRANCGTTETTCLLSRTQPRTQAFTGGVRTDSYQCLVTTTGSGTASCGLPFGDATSGNIGSFSNVGVTNVSYSAAVAGNVDTERVTNFTYEEPVENDGTIAFGWSGLVPGAGLTFGTNVLANITNTGDATATAAIVSIGVGGNGGASRPITVTVGITYTVPSSFDNGGTGGSNFPLSATQEAGTTAPAFTASSALINNVPIADGADRQVTGSYNITNPTGVGGVVIVDGFGADGNPYSVPTGRGRQHSFSITNSGGDSVTYRFTTSSGA